MTSHRSKSLYAIKECSTCGRLYTKECCSIGRLDDKILVPEPDSSPCCAKCGTPVDGPSCRGCAFLRKEFEEDLLAYCIENGIFQDFQDTSESSDDNINVVNALREPCVVNQDPGVKFWQEPPQIDYNCCYECSDSLDGIFCRQCICKSCGKGAHFGYNCPPKDQIISKPFKPVHGHCIMQTNLSDSPLLGVHRRQVLSLEEYKIILKPDLVIATVADKKTDSNLFYPLVRQGKTPSVPLKFKGCGTSRNQCKSILVEV
ncbi:hypothetical protein Tco_0138530 [Tanacetum coccineum]